MNNAPLNEAICDTLTGRVMRGFSAWFTQLTKAIPWATSYSSPATSLNFPNILAGTEQTLTITVRGARTGDAVTVNTANVSGLIFSAAVTAADTVTVYAKNYTAAPINPGAQDFTVTVLQN